MEIDLWDIEFQDICQDIKAVEGKINVRAQTFIGQVAKKYRIVHQVQDYVDRLQTRYKRLGESMPQEPKKAKALVYWASELSNQGQSLLNHYEAYLRQYMWIQLFKIRFLGDGTESKSYLIDDLELETLSERYRSLKQMEGYLHKKNFQLRQAEKELRLTYDQLQTEEQNFLAGHSLQKQWGIGAVKAQRNPILGEIEKLIFGIAFKANPKIQEATQLKILSRDFNRKSQSIMDECRALMEHNDRLARPQFDPGKVRRIKDSLKKIRHLESTASKLALRAMPLSQASSPILLKKNSSQVKTTTGHVS
ncbi:hypothetical protein [Pseudobacteriovorax antillogorgiicola]|uniref:Uncharacterized protein n=1 Tax=Pseudobacteriovorax antillogorgiicola TaxID=1513793 RepID=A0A1Y6C4Y2_9BACT|nr:hypothetical protein [Pseudobacteriovorax antillogorgiicola]TCS49493.1 hypothetical protein EDD56_115175 [Pseudobacteriovorax antillogorgiicola]SMF45946.1 hypothetical protein SAMN06296036_11410 [Pseudobacteriovorax antillogorgiicola]